MKNRKELLKKRKLGIGQFSFMDLKEAYMDLYNISIQKTELMENGQGMTLKDSYTDLILGYKRELLKKDQIIKEKKEVIRQLKTLIKFTEDKKRVEIDLKHRFKCKGKTIAFRKYKKER